MLWQKTLLPLDVFQGAVTKGVRNISFGDLSGNLGRTMYKFKFQIPSYFSLVIRSLAVLEGIAISFNPDYKVLGSSYPWIARKVLTDKSPKLQSTLKTLLYKDGYFSIDRLESLLTESLRARSEQSLVRKEGDNTNSNLAIKQLLTFVLTEKGAFVRDILLQEFVKGLDALGLATLDYVSSAASSRLLLPVSLPSSSVSDEDITNLRTLRRVLLLLSRFQKNEAPLMVVQDAKIDRKQEYVVEASLVLYQMASFEEFWPILSLIPELPSETQQQLVLLPADVAGRLLSRMAARTMRRLFAQE